MSEIDHTHAITSRRSYIMLTARRVCVADAVCVCVAVSRARRSRAVSSLRGAALRLSQGCERARAAAGACAHERLLTPYQY